MFPLRHPTEREGNANGYKQQGKMCEEPFHFQRARSQAVHRKAMGLIVFSSCDLRLRINVSDGGSALLQLVGLSFPAELPANSGQILEDLRQSGIIRIRGFLENLQ